MLALNKEKSGKLKKLQASCPNTLTKLNLKKIKFKKNLKMEKQRLVLQVKRAVIQISRWS